MIKPIIIIILLFLFLVYILAFWTNQIDSVKTELYKEEYDLADYLPRQVLINDIKSFDIEDYSDIFPSVIKPFRGENGSAVEIIKNKQSLVDYKEKMKPFTEKYPKYKFVMQEYAPGPYEVGISVYYNKSLKRHQVVSIGLRPNKISNSYEDEINNFVPMNYRVVGCEPANELMTPELDKVFSHICSKIKGLYYGRFDVRFTDMKEFKNGRGFKILELNTVFNDGANCVCSGYKLGYCYQHLLYRGGAVFNNLTGGALGATTESIHRTMRSINNKLISRDLDKIGMTFYTN